jgi:hypothetical protein
MESGMQEDSEARGECFEFLVDTGSRNDGLLCCYWKAARVS